MNHEDTEMPIGPCPGCGYEDQLKISGLCGSCDQPSPSLIETLNRVVEGEA